MPAPFISASIKTTNPFKSGSGQSGRGLFISPAFLLLVIKNSLEKYTKNIFKNYKLLFN